VRILRSRLARVLIGALGGAVAFIGIGQVWAAFGSH
jgi:hypothetical protein